MRCYIGSVTAYTNRITTTKQPQLRNSHFPAFSHGPPPPASTRGDDTYSISILTMRVLREKHFEQQLTKSQTSHCLLTDDLSAHTYFHVLSYPVWFHGSGIPMIDYRISRWCCAKTSNENHPFSWFSVVSLKVLYVTVRHFQLSVHQ